MVNAYNLLLPPDNPTTIAAVQEYKQGALTESHGLSIVTANIGRGYGTRRKLRNNIRKIIQNRVNAIIGFQEIDEADTAPEAKVIRNQSRRTHQIVGYRRQTPILIPNDYNILDRRVKKISDGVTNLSPNRYAVSAIIQHKRHNVAPFVVLNSHAPRSHPKLTIARNDWKRGMRREIDRYIRKGFTVFVTCDPNGINIPGVNWQINRPIDRIGYVQETVKVSVVAVRPTIDLTIDSHDAYTVRYKVSNNVRT